MEHLVWICFIFLLQFGLLNFLDNVIFMRFWRFLVFVFNLYGVFDAKKKKESLNLEHKEFKESLLKSYIKGAF